jgi:hypothetical protein
MLHGVERQFERFFYILGIPKIDLYELAEVKFYVGEWPCELIICCLIVLKDGFVDVDKVIFRGVERPYELIF